MVAVGAVCAAARRGDIWGSVGRDGLHGMSGPVSSQARYSGGQKPGSAQLEPTAQPP